MSLISFATWIFFALVFVGLLLGFFRGWKKSLVRTCILVGVLIVSVIIAPILATAFMDRFVSGSNISIFSSTCIGSINA